MEYFNSFNNKLWENKNFVKKMVDKTKQKKNDCEVISEDEKFMDITVGEWILGVTMGIYEKDEDGVSKVKVMAGKFESWENKYGEIILKFCSPELKVHIFKLLINEYLQRSDKELWLSDDEKQVWNDAYHKNGKYYDTGMEKVLQAIKEGIPEKGFYSQGRMDWIEYCAENLDVEAIKNKIQLPYNENLVSLFSFSHKGLRDLVNVRDSSNYSYSDLGFDMATYMRKEDRPRYLTELVRAEIDILYFSMKKEAKKKDLRGIISNVCLDLCNGWDVIESLKIGKEAELSYLEMVNSQLKKIEEIAPYSNNEKTEAMIVSCKNAFLTKMSESPIIKNLDFISELESEKSDLTLDDLNPEVIKTVTLTIDVEKYSAYQYKIAKKFFDIDMDYFYKAIKNSHGELLNIENITIHLINNGEKIKFSLTQPKNYPNERFEEVGNEILQNLARSSVLDLSAENLMVLETEVLMRDDLKNKQTPLKKHIGVKF